MEIRQINDSENIMVSVVMPTFNHEKFIAKAIQSILDQKTTFKYELIIGNDHSTDGTTEIINAYAKQYPDTIRIIVPDESKRIYVNKRPTGRYNLINCLQNANGKYIAICEGDDYWIEPLKLQKQVDILEVNPKANLCVALNKKININTAEETINPPHAHPQVPLFSIKDVTSHYFHTTTYLLRKDPLMKVLGIYPHLLLGDTALRYLLINEGPFIVLNELVSVYRMTGNGLWSSLNSHQRNQSHHTLYSKLRRFHVKEYRLFYLNEEIKYLKKIVEYHNKNKKISLFLTQYINLFFLKIYRKFILTR